VPPQMNPNDPRCFGKSSLHNASLILLRFVIRHREEIAVDAFLNAERYMDIEVIRHSTILKQEVTSAPGILSSAMKMAGRGPGNPFSTIIYKTGCPGRT
jgi:hypothetical protein